MNVYYPLGHGLGQKGFSFSLGAEGTSAHDVGGEDMEQLGEEKGGSSGGIARPLLMVVGGGCALSAVAIGVLLLLASSHMVIKAKCSPLEDPRIEQRIRDRDPSDGSLLPGGPASPDSPSCFAFDTDDRVNKTKKCDKAQPNLYRAVVRVEGPSHVPDTFACCVCKWQEGLLTPATLQWLHTKQGGGQRFSTPRPSSTTRVSSSRVLSPGAVVSRGVCGERRHAYNLAYHPCSHTAPTPRLQANGQGFGAQRGTTGT